MFKKWTKKEIFRWCLRNNYGEPRFSGKHRIMYIEKRHPWGDRLLTELASKLGYQLKFN